MKEININTLENCLNDLLVLTENVRVYVPIIKNSNILKDVELVMCERFGGTSSIKVNGSYIMSDGNIEYDNIVIVESFTNELNNNDIEFLVELCKKLKNDLEQEAMSLEINKKLYFV